jgi:hypothetical protein
MKRIKRNKLTSVERDAELRAEVRTILRELGVPIADGKGRPRPTETARG